MTTLEQVLLALWEDCSGAADCALAAGRTRAALGAHAAVDGLALFGLQGKLLERLAATPPGAETSASAAALAAAARWCERESVARIDLARPEQRARSSAGGARAARGARRPDLAGLRALATWIPAAEVLAVALASEAEPIGLALFATRRPSGFTAAEVDLAVLAARPLAAAVAAARRAREKDELRASAEADRHALLQRLGRTSLEDSVIGAEQGLRAVFERAELVQGSDVPVLLLGETGSGKEVVARAIHRASPRRHGPFLRLNCGAIPHELIDSQLFGHERGSFTGAEDLRLGWFERAHRGTLFLDEIGELPPAAQVRLLRVLQDGSFERVGGQATLHSDCRLIAATHRDLPALVQQGQFREDLWYRLSVFPVAIPPLRMRAADLPALVEHFAERAARRFGLPACAATPADLERLAHYAWPGNVRELQAVIDRACLLGGGRALDVAGALGPQLATAAESAAADGHFPTLGEAQRAHVESALARTRGRIEGPAGAAQLLGVNPHTLRSRMRKLGVDWARFRP